MHFGNATQRTAFVFCKAKNTAFCRFLTFWFAEHFPLENVMLNILLRKMYAEHFPLENVRQNAFVTFCVTKCTHQMHFCIKCIFAQPKCILASNAFLNQQNVRVASLFFAKQKTQHFCIKCIFVQPKCILAYI